MNGENQLDPFNIVLFKIFFIPVYSLVSRLWKGEGALFFLTAFLVLRYENSELDFYKKVGLMFAALALMYALNDIHDAPYDMKDPTRANSWHATLAKRQKLAYYIHAIQVLLFTILCVVLPFMDFASFALASTVSMTYSFWAKSKPGFDFLLVFLWGPSFIYMFSQAIPIYLMLNVGLMLVMSHAFQMRRDHEMDEKNGLKTSAVYSDLLLKIVFFSASIAVILDFVLVNHLYAAGFSLSGVGLTLFLGFSQRSWLMVKFSQALAWFTVLYF